MDVQQILLQGLNRLQTSDDCHFKRSLLIGCTQYLRELKHVYSNYAIVTPIWLLSDQEKVELQQLIHSFNQHMQIAEQVIRCCNEMRIMDYGA
jgi:hypothetical protein